MTPKLQRIRVLSDGRPGHENQSLGLAEALSRRMGAAVECVRLDLQGSWLARVKQARALTPGAAAPQLLIAAGHRTHLPLLFAARRFHAHSVVIMKPSLPAGWFDLCLVPRHDLQGAKPHPRIVPTRGALNRIPEAIAAKMDTGVILIGGPSKHHGWAGEALLAAISDIVRRRPELAWTVGDSRRTPGGFLRRVGAAGLPITIVPHEETKPGWLPAVLSSARETWVTEDSVSMIFEAVTAGARVGVLPVPVKYAGGRTVMAVHDLIADGFARTYEEWQKNPDASVTSPVLHETARCADIVVKQFFLHS